ncbi:MAG: GNAT family N-acetyltransferase [Candidatus Omnitrophica bacterium]|nr:GNAT family N-acetyltransferase [Candidatus Omnitrophota bacterium]MCK5492056.1 GNAT family N-acetyltransferase [Candidatus Omnitrophota bacterium]
MLSLKKAVKIYIRYMTEKDLPAVLLMTTEEGWISDLIEFQTFIEFNPFGCFVYVEAGKIVGSIMTFQHTQSAWIGNFIVSREYRGKGIGKKLLSRAIEYLDKKKKKQIYLNAAYEAKNLYKKFGFKEVIRVNRWQGKAVRFTNNMETLQEIIPDILGFVKLDTSLWKDERFCLISQRSSLCHSYSYSEPSGFLMYGNVGNIITIGPWELKGKDKSIAEKLFISALFKLNTKSKIFLDVPSINKKAERILAKYKFKIIRSSLFMCRGRLLKICFSEIFSFATMGSMG